MKHASDIVREIQKIPCVDSDLALGLIELGVYSLSDLKQASPESLFEKLSRMRQQQLDQCTLYMLKCAVYYASHNDHDPELLKWWNWKGKSVK